MNLPGVYQVKIDSLKQCILPHRDVSDASRGGYLFALFASIVLFAPAQR